jgi:pyridinium-3,5-bisthiocarboxylic acid mononucleotide nickel chelatase
MIAYFDCTNGVAGDMLVAALVDAGVPWPELQEQLAGLNLPGYTLTLADVTRSGIKAKHFQVALDHHHHHHRGLNDITQIIQNASLPAQVKANAVKVFTTLAQAEAHVHNCPIADVHFHEVGAVDSIVDIVGTCIGLELLGIKTIHFSKIAVGAGHVKSAHGLLPVPAPATAKLLENQIIHAGDRTGELATPTGAALLTALGSQRLDLPELALKAIGYGAGTRDDPSHPNVVRVFLGRIESQAAQTDEISVISFNVDDITAEHLAFVADQLFAKGALDVLQIPAFMKKGRSATLVQVLSPLEKEKDLVEFILTQSTSFGLRLTHEKRYKLARDFIVIVLPEGKVRVKLGYLGEKLVQISPEFEDCRKIAERTGLNFRHLYARATELARQELENK